MQNHIPYGDYYSPNEYKENVSGSLISDENTKIVLLPTLKVLNTQIRL